MKVAFLTANQFTDESWTDPRVYKPAQVLLQAGHEVVVLGTGKYGQVPPPQEVKDGIRVIRRPTLMHRLYALLKPPAAVSKQRTEKRNSGRVVILTSDGTLSGEKSPSNSPQKRIDAPGARWHKYPYTTMRPKSPLSL